VNCGRLGISVWSAVTSRPWTGSSALLMIWDLGLHP
jgi:hypothetical protein